jgi:hypothetical protein
MPAPLLVLLVLVLVQWPASVGSGATSSAVGEWQAGSGDVELPAAGAAVDVASCDELSDEDFDARYLRGSRPLQLRGAAANWSAAENWSTKARFSALYGDNQRQARWAGGGNQFGILARSTFVRDYLAEMGTNEAAGREGLLFDEGLGHAHDWVTPPLFDRAGLNDTVVSVGAAGQGLPFHNHASAWQTVVIGRKAFLLLPPLSADTAGDSWLRAEPWFEEILSTLFLPSTAQFLQRHASDLWRMVPEAAQALRVVVLGPGDSLFVPCNWYHATINLDDTVAVGGQATLESGLGRCPADVFGAASKAYSKSVSALKSAKKLSKKATAAATGEAERFIGEATELGEQACTINNFNFACPSHLAALRATRQRQRAGGSKTADMKEGDVDGAARTLQLYVAISLVVVPVLPAPASALPDAFATTNQASHSLSFSVLCYAVLCYAVTTGTKTQRDATVRKRVFLRHLYKNDHFTKTGSGQT